MTIFETTKTFFLSDLIQLNIKKYENKEYTSLLVDIRRVVNSKFTKVGVCMRPREFFWLVDILKQGKKSASYREKDREILVKLDEALIELTMKTEFDNEKKCRTIILDKNEMEQLLKFSNEIKMLTKNFV